ncbi:MAG: DUF454 domain-containing protein [Rubrivivax sp.]|nr:MAG: DUF454 domain-containing protein [Rubrivivax sp.]
MDTSPPSIPLQATPPAASTAASSSAAEQAEQQLRCWQARTWRTLGAVSVAIGLVNAFIPLLPTTIFLLIGLWAYGKGDPHLRERLLAHPRFGPSLRRWVEHRQISTQAKVAACAGIAASGAITAWSMGLTPLTWVVLAGLAFLSLYLATRPGACAAGAEQGSVS